MNSGTTDTARANGAENRPGFRSRTVRVASHELVSHADPRHSGARGADDLDAGFHVNELASGRSRPDWFALKFREQFQWIGQAHGCQV